jgi:hypothetical protein
MAHSLAILGISAPKCENIPRSIIKKLCKNKTESLDSSISLEQYTQWIWECIHKNPRTIFPELHLFQSITIRPWNIIARTYGIRISSSEIRISGWIGMTYHSYIFTIKLTLRESQ